MPPHVVGAWAVAIGFVVMTAGCGETLWKQPGAVSTVAQQAEPQASASVEEQSPESPPVQPDRQVNDAREQVLAFINRLDEGGHPEGKRGDSRGGGSIQEPPEPEHEDAEHAAPAAPPHGHEQPAAPARATANSATSLDQPEEAAMEPAKPQMERPRIVKVSLRAGRDAGAAPSPSMGISDELPNSEDMEIANRPLGDAMSARTEDGIDATIQSLSRQVAASPNDVRAQWRLALLRLAVGDATEAAAGSADMLEDSAVLLRHSVEAMSAARRATEDPLNATGEALSCVDALRTELRHRAPLEIPTVALCSRVQAFGMYDVLAENAFRPHTQNQAIVYIEVGNFKSEPTGDGRFRTLLSDHLEVLTPAGESVWEHTEASIEDFCARMREDFFVAQRVALPAKLGEGDYVLKVTVEDLVAKKRTQAIHPFKIGGAAAGR